jgi:CPA1 family monovalent cation:H+ antiporter
MLVFETLLGLLAASLALVVIARSIRVPSAVALVIGGMTLAFVPGVPGITLQPELALALFLPPLLQLSAYRTDWTLFRENLTPILLLAVGAVVFTAGAVAVVAKQLIPDLPWAAAVALGAIVAPPDAVSATSVLRGFRLPKRIVSVLEGESLINDASALILYRFAIVATVAGSVSVADASLSFLLSAAGGAASGLGVGWIAHRIILRSDNRLVEIVITFLAAFASYFVAEAVNVSGVLAAVACGGFMGRRQLELAARTRLESNSAWEFVEFVLVSLIFMLIGLQLRGITDRLAEYDLGRLAALAFTVSFTLIASRIIWVFATFYRPITLWRAIKGDKLNPPVGHPTIVAWAGMRGVVSLAAALALPFAFPSRDVIIFLAFCSILATLVLQGTTLGFLIRLVDAKDDEIGTATPPVVTARKEVAEAALGALSEKLEDPEHGDVAETLVEDFKERVAHAEHMDVDAEGAQQRMESELKLRTAALEAARAKLVERRDELDGETLATLVQELDLEEEQIRVATGANQPV